MPQFLLLLFALTAVVALLYGFANANVATLARTLRRVAIAVLAMLGIVLTILGRWAYAMPLFFLAFAISRAGGGGVWRSSPGRTSRVNSSFLAMELDHDSGQMDGTVARGEFAGRRLSDLSDAELLELARELASDEQSATLLETYLERRRPEWYTPAGDGDEGASGASGASATMSTEDARRILGVAPNATDREIRAAHRAKMKDTHPDQGGSTTKAARLNQARDILLKKPSRQR